ncbi:Phosphotransferase enzyme family protein [Klenkia soli]|uniref:Phosphotransferase enzyme family protein n=1 Tax=Klenkia soli TaxID=1052260 RepID=A0A1H0TQU7_9ACTN|nr:aminoglycoside phosphotransferase family protein [Klenkia soli]SDP56359.1 Phosphotransferase enzyme family protein [Klenkia soli]
MDLGVDRARAILLDALGRDPGPVQAVDSLSQSVFLGADVVLKVSTSAEQGGRLDRETGLLPHLPQGLTAPLLAAGTADLGGTTIRYACQTRVPGSAPGIDLPTADETSVRRWAVQAIGMLDLLHGWQPDDDAGRILGDGVDDGSFAGRAPLEQDIDALSATGILSDRTVDGLAAVAARAPRRRRSDVPVHADCHWGNWLVHGRDVTALLDFEWARWGDPVDDWFFLIRFSGAFRSAVLAEVVGASGLPEEDFRAGCEHREAAHLVSDLLQASAYGDEGAPGGGRSLLELDEVVRGSWWA